MPRRKRNKGEQSRAGTSSGNVSMSNDVVVTPPLDASASSSSVQPTTPKKPSIESKHKEKAEPVERQRKEKELSKKKDGNDPIITQPLSNAQVAVKIKELQQGVTKLKVELEKSEEKKDNEIIAADVTSGSSETTNLETNAPPASQPSVASGSSSSVPPLSAEFVNKLEETERGVAELKAQLIAGEDKKSAVPPDAPPAANVASRSKTTESISDLFDLSSGQNKKQSKEEEKEELSVKSEKYIEKTDRKEKPKRLLSLSSPSSLELGSSSTTTSVTVRCTAEIQDPDKDEASAGPSSSSLPRNQVERKGGSMFFKKAAAALAMISAIMFFLLHFKMRINKQKSLAVTLGTTLIGSILIMFKGRRGEKKSVVSTPSEAEPEPGAGLSDDDAVDDALKQQNKSWFSGWLWKSTPDASPSGSAGIPSPTSPSSRYER